MSNPSVQEQGSNCTGPGTGAGSRQNAHWSKEEEAALVDFLLSKETDKGECAMFNAQIFGEAAKHLKSLHKRGAEKTARSCKTKWQHVGISFV